MKRSEAKSVGQILDEMIAATGNTVTYDRQRVCYLWSEVVGPAINRYTSRRYIDERGVMHVHIDSAALKNELSYLRDTLVRQLNEAAGKEVINAIIIH